MKTFILLSAIPGSGKSTWAEEYRLTHDNVHIVASDSIRREFYGQIQDHEHEDIVWKTYHDRILEYRDLEEDSTVIADATHITNWHRTHYAEHATGFDKKILVLFKKKKEEFLEGNKKRGSDRIVPDEAMEHMMNKWEDPTEEVLKLYDEIIIIDKHFEAPHVKDKFHFE